MMILKKKKNIEETNYVGWMYFTVIITLAALMLAACQPSPDLLPEPTLTPTVEEMPEGDQLDQISGETGGAAGTGGSGSITNGGTSGENGTDLLFGDAGLLPDDLARLCGQVMGSGACYHPYIPVAEGFSLTYQNEDGEVTQTISAVQADRFFVSTEDPEGKQVETEYTCSADGMRGFEIGNEVFEMLGDVPGSYSSVEIDGIAMPVDIKAGDTWQMTVTIIMGVQQAGVDSKNIIVLDVDFTAAGEEQVSVPAGTFTTMRVDYVTRGENNLEVTGTVSMSQLLATIESSGSEWYVECLGKVKSASRSSVSGIASFESENQMELSGIRLP